MLQKHLFWLLGRPTLAPSSLALASCLCVSSSIVITLQHFQDLTACDNGQQHLRRCTRPRACLQLAIACSQELVHRRSILHVDTTWWPRPTPDFPQTLHVCGLAADLASCACCRQRA